MVIPQRYEYMSKPTTDLKLTPGTFANQQIKIAVPRKGALRAIKIYFQATMASLVVTQKADGFLNVLKKANLYINDGRRPYSRVDITGAGLLEYGAYAGLNLDRSTLMALFMKNAAYFPASALVRICYTIPLCLPNVTDKLALYSLLPIHTYSADPVLTLDWSAASEMSSTADPFSATNCEIEFVYHDMPDKVTNAILADGGFLDQDLIETTNTLATNQTDKEFRAVIPAPGKVSSIVMRQFQGNATATRADLSANTSVDSETKWRLELAGAVKHEWRMKHLQTINDEARPLGASGLFSPYGFAAYGASYVQATNVAMAAAFNAPNFGGALAAGSGIQDAASVALDFISPGVTEVRELGGLLDLDSADSKGLKCEIIGNVTTPSSQASAFNTICHRFTSRNVANFQAV